MKTTAILVALFGVSVTSAFEPIIEARLAQLVMGVTEVIITTTVTTTFTSIEEAEFTGGRGRMFTGRDIQSTGEGMPRIQSVPQYEASTGKKKAGLLVQISRVVGPGPARITAAAVKDASVRQVFHASDGSGWSDSRHGGSRKEKSPAEKFWSGKIPTMQAFELQV